MRRTSDKTQIRVNILIVIVWVIAFIFAVRLFQLQVIDGGKYREQSQRKILRSETIEASRGEIYDRNGVVIASNRLGYDLEIYRVGLTNEQLNKVIFNVITILENNGDTFYSTIPIGSYEAKEIRFYSNYAKSRYVETFGFNDEIDAEELLVKLYQKYDLINSEYTDEMKYKIGAIRYEISINGFSLFNAVKIAKDISYDSMAYIEEMGKDLGGVKVKTITKRVYQYGSLAAHVLGYIGSIDEAEYAKLKNDGYKQNSIIGKLGIEQFMETYLKGNDGILRSNVDAMGNVNYEYIYKETTSGKNVTLTLEYNLQKVSENVLKDIITQLQKGSLSSGKYIDADAGAVVVTDVKTGEVLALASYPTYNPNIFVSGISYSDWNTINSDETKPMFNRAIQGTYSPGSTYKMITALAGLENNTITTTEKILDEGKYPYGYNPLCWIYAERGTTHGYVTVSDAIKVSCNCYFYEVGRRTGIEEIVKYAKMFGLDEKTGIELVQETKGVIAGTQNIDWYLGDTLSAAIGQSYNSFTPTEMCNYIATLCNGGIKNRLTLIKNIENLDGGYVSDTQLHAYIEQATGYKYNETTLALNEEYVKTVLEGMHRSSKETGGGVYYIFGNSSVDVAGKTGTAEVSNGSASALFAGFAPYDNPEIAIVVVIEHGGQGLNAALVAKPILEEYFKIKEKNNNITDIQSVIEPKVVY